MSGITLPYNMILNVTDKCPVCQILSNTLNCSTASQLWQSCYTIQHGVCPLHQVQHGASLHTLVMTVVMMAGLVIPPH